MILEEKKEKRKLSPKKTRKEHKDNIRKKIKRGFLNNALTKNLNSKLKEIGINNYFEKFPQFFASDVDRKRNKKNFKFNFTRNFGRKRFIYK